MAETRNLGEKEVSDLVGKVEGLHELFGKQEIVHGEAIDQYPELHVNVKRSLTASAAAYSRVKQMIEERFSQYKPEDLVAMIREFHAAVKGLEDANKKLLMDYVATGIGDRGAYLTYQDIRATIEQRLGKCLEEEQKPQNLGNLRKEFEEAVDEVEKAAEEAGRGGQ